MSQVANDDDLLEEFESERPGRHLSGITGAVVAVGCAGLSIFAISWVVNPLEAGVYRPAFLAIALFLTFLVFGAKGNRDSRPTVADWTLAILSLVAAGYASVTSDELFRHAADPTTVDLIFGIVTILLVLEATRRTVGWILPAICIAFLAYAYLGGLIPEATRLGHKGYGLDRIIGQTYLGLEGIFGIPLDVAATYIVLFAVYGAVLEYSGASRFFVELSHAAFGGSATGPGRTTTLAGFLLGTVSGSGVATTVTLGSVSWPLLRRAGYPKDEGGGILAAAGIGAILSPPTLGAAAFIIAELLEISYLEVLVYALVPSLLYYLGILLAIEADARKHGVKGIDLKTSRLLAAAGAVGLPLRVARRSSSCCSGSASRRSARSCTRRCSRSSCRSWTGATAWARAGSARRWWRARAASCPSRRRPRRPGSWWPSSRSPGWAWSCRRSSWTPRAGRSR